MKTNILSINTIMETTYSIKNFAMRIITAVILLCVLGVGNTWGATKTYTKITSTSNLTADEKYLIVCENQTRVFKASAASSGATAESESVTITSNTITCDDSYAFTITGSTDSWKITGTNGSIGHISGTNTLGVNSTITNAITFDNSGNADILCDSRYLRCNPNNGNPLFRYYTSGQTAVQLYKESGSGGGFSVMYDANTGSGTMTDSNSPYDEDATVTVLSSTFTAPDGYVFDHWNTAANGSGQDYDPGDSFTITDDITLYAQWEPAPALNYVLADISELTSEDVFIIVGNTGSSNFAMSNNNGTTNPPAAVSVTVTNDVISTASTTILWNISGNASDGYTFYPNGTTAKWLYCNNSNDGVRVGTNANNAFTISGGYLFHGVTSRYVGIYTTNNDWRCYDNNTGNIAGQTFAFYKQEPELTFFRTKCYREFTDEEGDGLWGTDGNWTNSHQPNINDLARIKKPVTVDVTGAKAKNVILNQNGNTGKLTIQANKALEVAGTVTRTTDGSNSLPTRPEDLILESSSAGNATLIFDNSNSDQATVYLYSKGYTNKIIGDGGVWNWQFIGVPVTNATRLSDYYDGYMYEWDNSIPGWVDKTDFDATLTPFTAYSVSYPTTSDNLHTYEIDGTLVATGNKSIDIPKNTSVMAVANSWTAPIDIASITFTNTSPQNIFLYNTGYNYEDNAGTEGTRFAPGKYICVPKNSASIVGEPFIASMQGFLVKNKLNTDGTINIDYNTVVRPSTSRDIVAGELHAPARNKKEEAVAPVVMKIFVIGSEYDDRVILLEHEDFSRGFDDGWDGEKFQVNAVKTAPRLFAINETGGKEEISAVPEMEGTVIGFRPGTDANYKITFEYEGEKTLYLLDTKTGFSTLICSTCEYEFSSNGENEDARFIIAKSPATATGVENSTAGSANVYKMVLDDHIYIIRNGKMYDVTGILCK